MLSLILNFRAEVTDVLLLTLPLGQLGSKTVITCCFRAAAKILGCTGSTSVAASSQGFESAMLHAAPLRLELSAAGNSGHAADALLHLSAIDSVRIVFHPLRSIFQLGATHAP